MDTTANGFRELDDIDRRILDALRDDGRISNAAIAEQVGIAPSTAHARLRGLVARGVITQFRADISPEALGLTIQALISVAIRAGARRELNGFLDRMRTLPEVRQVFFLGGSEDFIIHIAARDTDAVRVFVLDQLSADPVVASTRTSLVFEHVQGY